MARRVIEEYTAEELRELHDDDIATLLYGVLLTCTLEGARICKEAAERLKDRASTDNSESDG